MTDKNLKKSPLFDSHQAAKAVFGQRGDFCVPLSYTGPVGEAQQVTQRAGVIDMSHMGRIRIRGDQMLDLIEKTFTHDVAHQEDDTICDSLILNEQSGILADCQIMRLDDEWLIICDTINRDKILNHLNNLAEAMEVKITDRTDNTAHIAIFGNQAAEILKTALPEDPNSIPEGNLKVNSLLLAKYIAIRKNLGNIWGFQVILPKLFAGKAWRYITQKAEANCIKPLGIGGLEILCMEQGLPRYGWELNQTIDPMIAGLENRINFNHDFIGKEAFKKISSAPTGRKRVGLILETSSPSAIPTIGMSLFRHDGLEVGTVTSGTYSPSLNTVIAQGYVTSETATDKPAVTVELTDQSNPIKASIVELPFV